MKKQFTHSFIFSFSFAIAFVLTFTLGTALAKMEKVECPQDFIEKHKIAICLQ